MDHCTTHCKQFEKALDVMHKLGYLKNYEFFLNVLFFTSNSILTLESHANRII